MTTRSTTRKIAIAIAVVASLVLAGCGAGSSGSGSHSITVLMVNNPPMLELQKLTAENFTKETGIKVHFVVKVEQDMRDTASTEFANQSGQYDVATLSNFEIPYYAKAGWISDMQSIAKDSDVRPVRHPAVDDRGPVLQRTRSTASRSTASPRS